MLLFSLIQLDSERRGSWKECVHSFDVNRLDWRLVSIHNVAMTTKDLSKLQFFNLVTTCHVYKHGKQRHSESESLTFHNNRAPLKNYDL